jgi:putative ABC transport system permease protein
LREEGAEVEAVEMFRAVLGLPVAMVGMAVLLLGLDGVYNGPLLTGIGALVVFLGVAVLAPVIARPVARVIAWPLPRLFGVHGNLARENASRNPRRTAATAAALMIGLALVAFVSVFAASIKASASRALDEMLAADFIITPQRAGGPAPGLAPVVALEMRRRPELTSVTPLRISPWRPGGEPEGDVRSVSAADPRVLGDVADLGVVEGTLSRLGPREVFVRDQTATERKLRVGDELVMEFPRKEPVPFRVAGLFAERRLIGSSYLISLAAFNSLVEDPSDVVVFAKAAPTASLEQARQALAAIEERFPQIEVNDQAEFKAEQSGQVDQLVNLVYALLGLAILIALLGITNTLALSIFERTRELGLLRAVGMSRRRVRSMIRWEAVVVSVLGAALGLPIGVFFGWAMVRALADEGFGVFAVPIGRLVVFVVLAGLAGVLAAVLPARRAAKLDVLQAIATE